MSIKVIQWVWDCSESKNAERLVLLAIADNAADDGSHAYPSVAEICRKANLSERGVQAALARLVKSGELHIHVGGGRGHTNYYTVIMKPCARQTPQKVHPSAPGGEAQTPQNSTVNPADPALNPADPAPGTVLEPSVEPSFSFSDADASGPTAQTVIKGFIDWLSERPKPVKLTPSVIARYGKAVKVLLQAGHDDLTIKRAMVAMTERGKVGWPSMLDSFVVEVQNQRTSGAPSGAGRPQQFKVAAQIHEERAVERRTRAQVADEIRRQDPSVSIGDALELATQLIEQAGANALSTSAPTGYIEAEVIDNATPREVAGP